MYENQKREFQTSREKLEEIAHQKIVQTVLDVGEKDDALKYISKAVKTANGQLVNNYNMHKRQAQMNLMPIRNSLPSSIKEPQLSPLSGRQASKQVADADSDSAPESTPGYRYHK
jgi:hypothetical protein